MSNHKNIELIGGLIMVSAMILSIILSNTTSFSIITPTIEFIAKDILMVLFFIYVGIELRHEFHEGELSRSSQRILPLIATLGGMIIPSLIYLIVNISYPQNYIGFAIPCATDIAFAICLFNLLGKGLPHSIRIFFLSIAIFDDIGAILIIAIFYTNDFSLLWFVISLASVVFFWIAAKNNITNILVYIILGIILTIAFHKAGISTSVAGVLIGFLLPIYNGFAKHLADKLRPIVQFIILPIFAFTSSGIVLDTESIHSLFNPIIVGIVLGLFLGKQIGITLFSYITLRLGISNLPSGSKFFHIYNISIFAGIGFTMSLFVGMIAFKDLHSQNMVKIAVMLALIICVLFALLVKVLSPRGTK